MNVDDFGYSAAGGWVHPAVSTPIRSRRLEVAMCLPLDTAQTVRNLSRRARVRPPLMEMPTQRGLRRSPTKSVAMPPADSIEPSAIHRCWFRPASPAAPVFGNAIVGPPDGPVAAAATPDACVGVELGVRGATVAAVGGVLVLEGVAAVISVGTVLVD